MIWCLASYVITACICKASVGSGVQQWRLTLYTTPISRTDNTS